MSALRQLEVDAALGTWDPRLTAGIGMEPAAASKSQVLFYLSESASDLSGRTPQKDPSLKAVCFYSPSLLSHYSQPSSSSFSSSLDVPLKIVPFDSAEDDLHIFFPHLNTKYDSHPNRLLIQPVPFTF